MDFLDAGLTLLLLLTGYGIGRVFFKGQAKRESVKTGQKMAPRHQ